MDSLQELYERSNATLSLIANKTGFCVSTIQRYVNGKVKFPMPKYEDRIREELEKITSDKLNTDVNANKELGCECRNELNEFNDINNDTDNADNKINVNELKEQMNRNSVTSGNYHTYNTGTNTNIQHAIKRGDVWYIKNVYSSGSEQAFSRPCLVVSSDKLNSVLDVYTVIYLTSQEKNPLPTHVAIKTSRDSIALCEQLFSVTRSRFNNYLTHITDTEMEMIDRGITLTLGLQMKPQNINESHDYLRLQVENRMLREFNDNLIKIVMK